MAANKLMLLVLPAALMVAATIGMEGIEFWIAGFGTSPQSYQTLGRIGLAAPYAAAAIIGVVYLLAVKGSLSIRYAGWGVFLGGLAAAGIGIASEALRLTTIQSGFPSIPHSPLVDWFTLPGTVAPLGAAIFGLKVAQRGNMAFGATGPKRLKGARAVHGANDWMRDAQAAKLFPHWRHCRRGELSTRPRYSWRSRVWISVNPSTP